MKRAPQDGFTIIELLIVMSIIIVLAGLVLGVSGYAQKKAARSRAEAEIAAMSAALENYKSDNGIYPIDAQGNTTNIDPANADENGRRVSSKFLYAELSGDHSFNGSTSANAKSYFNFKPQMLGGQRDTNGVVTSVQYIRDPFGNSYGYSTAKNPDANQNAASAPGYNPTFDLWSTADSTNTAQWIKNW